MNGYLPDWIGPSAKLISQFPMQRELKIGSTWTPVERRANHSVMTYEIRVMCDEHYYGSGCANLCRPRDDNFGHYTCSPSGNVKCLEGWKGDYCTKREY
ncbi:hypothetical protein V9T40_007146 [Parthenolecanium corni]|uniref:Delta-like protein n=1 Tax=Parthenolecanium corni TaxID=536013 RepID=A0AAN9U4P4_9HEMI